MMQRHCTGQWDDVAWADGHAWRTGAGCAEVDGADWTVVGVVNSHIRDAWLGSAPNILESRHSP